MKDIKDIVNNKIVLNKRQSIFLILGIFLISGLSFTLGYIIGGNTEIGENISSRKDVVKSIGSIKESLIKESELTFYQSLTKDITDVPNEDVLEVDDNIAKKIDESKKIREQVDKKEPASQIISTNEIFAKKPDDINMHKPDNSIRKREQAQKISSDAQDLYTVQVGSFKKREDAFNLKNSLERRGYDSYIITFSKDGIKWFRVRVGAINNRADASAIAKKIKTEEGLSTYIAIYSR